MDYLATRALVAAAVLSAGAAAWPNDARAQTTTIVIQIRGANPAPVRPHATIHNLREFSQAFARCWRAPPLDPRRQPVDVIFKVSFTRSGELFGKPRIVEFAHDVTPRQRTRYYAAVAEALDRCSHMPFSDSMGAAVAGRVFRINFIDARGRKSAEVPSLATTTD